MLKYILLYYTDLKVNNVFSIELPTYIYLNVSVINEKNCNQQYK